MESIVRLQERLLGWDEGMTDLRDDEIAYLRQHQDELTEHEVEILAALAGDEKVLHNGPAWSPPIANPGFDTDVGGADVFKSWAEETGAVGIEATWRPVRFSQSMTCPLCHETFEIIVTANVRGAAWMDDLSAVVPCAALAGEKP